MTNREQRARDVLYRAIAERDPTGAGQTRAVREGRCDVGAAIDAMLSFSDAERSAQPEAPEGWVMVPRKPTLDMKLAGQKHLTNIGCMRIWNAMLATAPTPPQQSAPTSDVLREQAQFLCDRLDELDWSVSFDEFGNAYYGHVDPAHHRLKATLADTTEPRRDVMVEALIRIEPLLSQLALPSRLDPDHSSEIRELGERIGYGALMHGASALWRVHLEENGGSGGEFVVGPCAATAEKAWTRLCLDIEEAKR